MRRKKSTPLIVLSVFILALVILFLWYTRPVTAAQLSPGLDRDALSVFSAWGERWYGAEGEPPDSKSFSLTLRSGDPFYEEARALTDAIQIKRYPSDLFLRLLPDDVIRGKQMEAGMVNWVISLDGGMFLLQYHAGRFSYSLPGSKRYLSCAVVNGDAVADTISEFLLEHCDPLLPSSL